MDHVCPLLALAHDRHAAIDGVDGAHRCHAEEPPAPLDRSTQSRLCLTPAHARCERYLAWVARTGVATPGRAPFAGGIVSTRQLLTPQPAWRGIAGRARRSRAAVVVVAGASAAAIGIAGIALGSGLIGDMSPDPTATAEPTARLTPSPRPTERPTPTAPVTPSPTVPPTPTPVPTPVPTPQPTAQQTYVVVAGDTLAGIAAQFGTTVAALQAANGIDDPNEINVGQVLVIP